MSPSDPSTRGPAATAAAGFMYAWQYRVPAGSRAAFLAAYGPDGDWVRLFRKANGYVDTALYQDTTDPERFITIDRWRSERQCREFRAAFAAEFEALDRLGEHWTTAETSIGEFSTIETAH